MSKTETQPTSNSTNWGSLASSQGGNKYMGLLLEPPIKVFQNNLFALINYINSESPKFNLIHKIVSIFRILQFILPALMTSLSIFWSDSKAHATVGFLSIFYKLIPNFAPIIYIKYILCIFIGIKTLLFISIYFASSYLRKSAKLPYFVPPIFSCYFAIFGYLLPNIALSMCGSLVSKLVINNKKINIFSFVIIFISFILALLYVWIYSKIFSHSLVFKPDSLMTINPKPQICIYIATECINFISEIIPAIPSFGKVVGTGILAVIYFLTTFIPSYQGGFVSSKIEKCVQACSITGTITCAIITILIASNLTGNLIFLFIIIIIFAIVWVICHFVRIRSTNIHLAYLDRIYEDESIFEIYMNSPNKVQNFAVDGYRSSHPICVSGTLLKMAIEKWPQNGSIWFMYTKFIVIYPENNVTLSWIFHTIRSSKVKGSEAKSIKKELIYIIRERESNLSQDLKNKLSGISKKMTASKHKLRYVWDLVIQGNIQELESATKRSQREIEATESEFSHLLRQFPNNRFVTRLYSRFVLDLKADKKAYEVLSEQSGMLQKNILIKDDTTKEFGLDAFPLLPSRISCAAGALMSERTSLDNITSNIELESEIDDTDNNEDNDHEILKQQIENMRIPSTRCVLCIRFFTLIALVLIPIIGILIYLNYYVDLLLEPISHSAAVIKTRRLIYQLSAYSMYYLYYMMGALHKPVEQDHFYQLSKNFNTKDQINFITKISSVDINKLQTFNSYKTSQVDLLQAQNLVFKEKINYTYFLNYSTQETSQIPMINIIIDFMIQSNHITQIRPEDINSSLLNTASMLNFYHNINSIAIHIGNIVTIFDHYTLWSYNTIYSIVLKIKIGYCILALIIHFILLAYEVKWVMSTKHEAYSALTAIPKNAVSNVIENLRNIKKDENSGETNGLSEDREINKQEDNVLKIFMAGNTSSSSITDQTIFIVTTLITAIFTIVCMLTLGNALKYMVRRIRESSPHLNNLNTVFSLTLSALMRLNVILAKEQGFEIPGYDRDQTLQDIDTSFKISMNSYHLLRFGGSDGSITPFIEFGKILEENSNLRKCNRSERQTTLLDVMRCYNPPMIQNSLSALINLKLRPWIVDGFQAGELDGKNDDFFAVIWSLLLHPQFDTFVVPMYSSIIPTLKRELNHKWNQLPPIVIPLTLISILLEICCAIQLKRIENHIKGVLRLFLHYPASDIYRNQKIMQILYGDFSKQKGDLSKRADDFYDELLQNLPMASIIYENIENKIEGSNKIAQKIFNDDLDGMKINDLLNSKKFVNISQNLFTKNEGYATYIKDGTEMHFELQIIKLKFSSALTLKDVTARVRYNKLIAEEKHKSDYLLSSILPQSLVHRVQAGEKDISFAVQSATIVFMDIVSFTPWCGSLPASQVMMTLNMLFKKFDQLVSSYNTMTKVKCIGDCYMAAGGVFAEINNPSEHCKEVVSFGLDAINAVLELNKEIEEKLQIRVGINTGGPIIAGVLGIGKPTFEILGPAINMAQQMEHHGVPMKVHVSRSVYELIYGDTFNIKERGSVEVKGGSVITYIVHGKED